MSKIATRKTKQGDLLKGEFMPQVGYERAVLTTLVDSAMEIGTVVKTDGDGTYSTVVAADVATLPADIAVVIDPTIYESDFSTPADTDIACLHGGPGASGGAVIVREQLKFGDSLSAGQVDTVVAAIEARGIKVGTQV